MLGLSSSCFSPVGERACLCVIGKSAPSCQRREADKEWNERRLGCCLVARRAHQQQETAIPNCRPISCVCCAWKSNRLSFFYPAFARFELFSTGLCYKPSEVSVLACQFFSRKEVEIRGGEVGVEARGRRTRKRPATAAVRHCRSYDS